MFTLLYNYPIYFNTYFLLTTYLLLTYLLLTYYLYSIWLILYYPKEIIQFDIAKITCNRNNIIENYNQCKNLLNDNNREYFNKFRLDEVVDKINELVVYLNSLSLTEEVIGTDDTFDYKKSTSKRCRFFKQLCKYDNIVFLYDYFIGGLLMLMEQNLFFNDNFFDKINNFIYNF